MVLIWRPEGKSHRLNFVFLVSLFLLSEFMQEPSDFIAGLRKGLVSDIPERRQLQPTLQPGVPSSTNTNRV
jgi:hypothetical protein